MRKKELGNLPALKAGNRDKIFLKMHDFEFLVKPERKIIHGDKILILNFYTRYKLLENDFSPVYRIFHTPNAFVTQNITDGSWTEQSMEFMFQINAFSRNAAIRTAYEEKMIRGFFRCGRSEMRWFQVINERQKEIRENKQKKRRRRMNAKTDQIFRRAKPPTDAFLNWAEEEAMYRSRYVFYDYEKKKYLKCFCSHCKTEFEMEQKKLRHNREGICPICKSPVTFKAKGKTGRFLDTGYAVKIERGNGNIILRHFILTKRYDASDVKENNFEWNERYRSVVSKGDVKDYIYRYSGSDERMGWYQRPLDPHFYYYCYHLNSTINEYETRNRLPGCLYLKNLKQVLKGTEIQYSAIEYFGRYNMHECFPVRRYILKYLAFPQLEYFVKAKLYHLVENIIATSSGTFGSESKDMRKTLGISKEKILIMQQYNWGLRELDILRRLEEGKVKLNEKEIYNFQLLYDSRVSNLIRYNEYAPLKKIVNYLLRQLANDYRVPVYTLGSNLEVLSGEQIRQFWNYSKDWGDYMGWSKDLKHEIRSKYVLFPKKLQLAHDKIMEEHRVYQKKRKYAEVQRERRRVNRILKEERSLLEDKIKKEEYFLKVPDDWKEIKRESDLLGHCVRDYIPKIARGECQIYFIRKAKAPDEPFYTMEWGAGKIKQCRGKGNCDYGEKVASFVDYVEQELEKLKEKHPERVA